MLLVFLLRQGKFIYFSKRQYMMLIRKYTGVEELTALLQPSMKLS